MNKFFRLYLSFMPPLDVVNALLLILCSLIFCATPKEWKKSVGESPKALIFNLLHKIYRWLFLWLSKEPNAISLNFKALTKNNHFTFCDIDLVKKSFSRVLVSLTHFDLFPSSWKRILTFNVHANNVGSAWAK